MMFILPLQYAIHNKFMMTDRSLYTNFVLDLLQTSFLYNLKSSNSKYLFLSSN